MEDVHRESLDEEATHATDEARMVLPGVEAILGFQRPRRDALAAVGAGMTVSAGALDIDASSSPDRASNRRALH
jgi:hypothetical protein